MSPQTPKHQPSGGDGLLFTIAASVIAIVSLEAVFIAFPSWWLLSLVLVSVIIATGGVVLALLRTIDGDTRLRPSVSLPAPQTRVAPTQTAGGILRTRSRTSYGSIGRPSAR